MEGRYNTRSPAVKRLMREAQELSEPTDQYFAQPLEDNLFEWHFTVRGPADTEFQHGIYHGRIILPPDYPMKPPSIIWLTPNGRFETNKKICLSISGHHPESWQPSWSIRTALLAIIGFMPTHSSGAIGALDYTPEERKILAKKSRDWKCPICGDISNILLPPNTSTESKQDTEAKELAAQINFQGEKSKKSSSGSTSSSSATAAAPESPAQNSSSQIDTTTTTTAPTTTTNPIGATIPPPAAPSLAPLQMLPPPPWAAAMPSAPSWIPRNIVDMMPRFPYPPSHYQNGYFSPFYPASYPNMGFPPPPPFPTPPRMGHSTSVDSPVQPTSVNPEAAEVTSNTTETATTATATPHLSTYTRTPISSPVSGSPQKPDNTCGASGTSGPADTETQKKADNEQVTNELRGVDSTNSQETNRVCSGSSDKLDQRAAGGVLQREEIGDVSQSFTEETLSKKSAVSQGLTDSEVSASLDQKKKESQCDVTGAEELPLDGEENSEAGALAIELSDTEQRSLLDRSIISSMPELDSAKNSPGKGLRHRSSAVAHVPTDSVDDTPPEAGAGVTEGHRIEAVAGDTQTRQRRPEVIHRALAGGLLRQNFRPVNNTRQSYVDGYTVAMVCLSLATLLILINRIYQFIEQA